MKQKVDQTGLLQNKYFQNIFILRNNTSQMYSTNCTGYWWWMEETLSGGSGPLVVLSIANFELPGRKITLESDAVASPNYYFMLRKSL